MQKGEGAFVEWLLQNKDTPLLLFCTARDEFGEVTATEIAWQSGQRPLGYRSLGPFLEKRKAPKHRRYIDRLLAAYGCQDLEGFLRISHALSLNDTLWVKPADAGLCWAGVSLYRNEFDELLAEAALNGGLAGSALSATTPEFGTDGQYAKCWKRRPDGVFLYKGGSAAYELEPLSEYLASQLAQKLCVSAVPYDMAFYRGRLVSTCRLFTSEETGLAKARDVLDGEPHITALLRYFASIQSEEAFRRMYILDALTLNIDRHLGNFGVLFCNDTMQVQGMAPVYDNNRSLLFDLDEDQLAAFEKHIRRYLPRLGADFIQTGRALLTDAIRSDLEALRHFAFRPHPQIAVEGRRLELLSQIVQTQVQKLLA